MVPLTGSAIFGFGRWLVTSQIGRALLLATALGLALWWAYSTVWQRGYDAAAAEGATCACARVLAQSRGRSAGNPSARPETPKEAERDATGTG
jgi:hypothetical protein